ncbi:Patatin-like phospholipase/acyl hydrolase [Thalassospira xiamenensis M-5 = DSM 17429]|uniref:Patatin n=1 Tax=Thalassospira xiamenensis M-5 = DSM 17429 TaxID=1123366 RepID=A0AB72UHH1_9PROT|nr:CBASS cGAMP-activated phospholipase [Thalassospira xiamenensis]AJD53584.1 patatin [Thalassospira xiamenensis M-5 = DSM 17429]SIT09347.1 Patatin-like phospholipase/acyl hydrolase [Thalassospira xiamenensis M-5 = DSM 17429]
MATYHVLALSGGGFRGLYTATALEILEKSAGEPLARKFDLICGTSAGGLLALGLANEHSASELKKLFVDNGTSIFQNRSLPRKIFGFWWCAKHSQSGLKSSLEKIFKNTQIGDLKHPVLISTINYSTGLFKTFKTPHHQDFSRDWELPIIDAALATSAAPVYFPLFRNERGVFADGGLAANAPGLLGVHELKHFLGATDKDVIRVLSIGTMTKGATFSGKNLDRGFFRWRAKIFDLTISAQESLTHYMLSHTLGDNYFQIDDAITPDQSKDIDKLDNASESAKSTLISRGDHAAQAALGDHRFKEFMHHTAAQPIFFHGPQKNG